MEENTQQITLVRYTTRAREDAIEGQRERMLQAVNNRSLQMQGWNLEADFSNGHPQGWQQAGQEGRRLRYEMYLQLTWRQIRQDLEHDSERGRAMLKALYSAAGAQSNGAWELETVDGKEYVPSSGIATPSIDNFIGYSEVHMPSNFESYFSHLYGLDSQIARVKKNLVAGINSNWMFRFNTALIGPPGCGKSDLCGTVKRALGEEAVLEFDATATTGAGAMKDLANREILPRVLIIEEIEKADPKSLEWALAVLDQRAEIRKVTHRETIQRETKLIGICTVNDEDQFRKISYGALASRFGKPVYFNYPSRDQLEMILTREVQKFDGNLAWIKPTLDYCIKAGEAHPREIISLCIAGGDDWLTDSGSGMSVMEKILDDTSKKPTATRVGVMDSDPFEGLDFDSWGVETETEDA